MASSICYSTAREAATAVCDELRARGREPMVAHPYQYQNPDRTLWWNIPSSQWPAYQHGKLFFSPEPPAGGGQAFCGLHVEKGLDASLAAVAASGKERRSVMTPEWLWHSFLADLGTPKLAAAVAAASSSTAAPLLLHLRSTYVLDVRRFDPTAPRPKGDRMTFEVSGATLRLHGPPELPVGLLSGLTAITTFPDLAAAIRAIPKYEFVWLDLLAGSPFALGDAATGWDAAEMWTRALAAWEPWLV